MADFDTLQAGIDAINAKLDGISVGSAAVAPPDVPELPLSAIDPATIDHKTVQRDGSTWAMQPAHAGMQGGPVQVIYGYISKAKNPAMWSRMVAAFGGDEARLQAILDANGKFARYVTHPDAILFQGPASFNLLSMLLASATPETPPTV